MSDNYEHIAIVTGATSGIGEATARKFIDAGFGVVGNGRNAAKLAELEQELGNTFCCVAGDASDYATLDKLFVAAEKRFGKNADIVVVNAGRGLGGSVTGSDLSQLEEVIKINLTGSFALMQKASKIMVEAQKDSYPKTAADIVVIGSVVGRHISPFSAAYGATKFAIHSLTEALRREIGPKGVRVSLVEPAVVISGFQEVAGYNDEMVQRFHDKFGPLLVSEDIANAIYHIVSQPPHVHICDVVVRPTRQDYP